VAVGRSELKGILAGMLLGDAFLGLDGGHNVRVQITHTAKQEEYLKYKAELLKNITSVSFYRYSSNGRKYPNEQIACRTRRHPFYTRIYEIVYSHGRKKVTKTWLSWLNEQGLAIWYMDDGTLCKRHRLNKGGRPLAFSRRVYLNTCGFSFDENQLLRDFLQERFGLNFKVCKNGKYWRLRAGAIEAKKLFAIIEPHIVPCMEYKLDMEYQQPDEGRSAQDQA